MKRLSTPGVRRLGVVAAVVVAAIGALALFLGTSGGSDQGDHRQFTVVARDSEGTITPPDFGAAPAQGQQAALDAPVYRREQKVGRAETILTITRVSGDGPEVIVECAVVLPKGQILFNGGMRFADLAEGAAVPVVGGTGAYARAAGTVVLQSSDPAETSLTFDIWTP